MNKLIIGLLEEISCHLNFDNYLSSWLVFIILRNSSTRIFSCIKSTIATDQSIKNKIFALHLVQLTVGTCWIDISHFAKVFTVEFICSWHNLLWTTNTLRYSIFSFRKAEKIWKLKLFDISASFFDCISDNIFRFHFPFFSILV